VIHIRCDHVEYRSFPALGLWAFHSHLFQDQHIVVREHFQQLYFAECRDRESILLIVHQDLLQREDLACHSMARLVYFTKGALAKLLHHVVLADFAASLETAL
jgi:hypothetical protein